MRPLVDLHEEIDEVNYFLNEWQKLRSSPEKKEKIKAKPEFRFVAHAIERVVKQADDLEIPLVLKTGKLPVVATKDRQIHKRAGRRNHFNWVIPSKSTIRLTAFAKYATTNGYKLSFVGNENGLISLRTLSEVIASGGELQIAGRHAGDWAS